MESWTEAVTEKKSTGGKDELSLKRNITKKATGMCDKIAAGIYDKIATAIYDGHGTEDQKTIYEPVHDETNKMTCASSKDSGQPGHPLSLRCVHEERLGP